ncbi:MAG: ABC transporter substrate-binding protein [Bacillota bacterium]
MRKHLVPLIALLAILFIVREAISALGWDNTGNRIVILLETLPDTLDPAMNSTPEVIQPVTGIYEGLVRLNPSTLVPEPCLAENWEVSEDGRRWTFHLKQGVRFSDGTELDSGAVKQSMDRVLQLRGSQPYASLVLGNVTSIETPGKYSVSFILKQPFAPIVKNLALPFAAPVVSPTALERYGDSFWKHPSGTGPYVLKSYSKKTIELAPNTEYRGGKPSGEIIFKAVPDPSERAGRLIGKKADIIMNPGPDNTALLRDAGMGVISVPGLDISYLGFYTDKPPFNNKNLRQAISSLIDKEKIVSETFGGEGVPAESFLPPPMSTYKNSAPLSHDADNVRRILSRLGYPEGINATLIAYEDKKRYCPSGGTALAEEIKSQLEPAGIRVTVLARPWEEHKEAILNRDGDFFLYGWTCDNGDQDNILYTLFSSSQVGQGLNATGLNNEQLDVYLVTARGVSDRDKRDFLYKKASEIIAGEAPAVAINHSMVRIAHNPRVKNVIASGFGLLDLYGLQKTE